MPLSEQHHASERGISFYFWAAAVFVLIGPVCLLSYGGLIDNDFAPRMLAASVVLAAVVLLAGFSRENPFQAIPKLVWVSLGALVVLSAVRIPFVLDSGEALLSIARWVLFAGALPVGVMVARKPALRLSAKLAVGLFVLVGAVLLFVQMGDVAQVAQSGLYQLTGLSVHKNLYASCLFLMIPFLLLPTGKQSHWSNRGGWALVAVAAAQLFLLQSRGVWMGLAAAGGLFVLLRFVRKGQVQQWLVWLWAAVVALAAVAALFSVSANMDLYSSVGERILLWEKTAELLPDYGWFGTGPGQWKAYIAKTGMQEFPKWHLYGASPLRPHNEFLMLLSELGIPGLLLVLGGGFVALRQLVTRLQGRETEATFLLLISTLLGFAAIAFFSFPLERVEHLLLLGITVGFLLTLPKPNQDTTEISPAIGKGLGLSLAVLFVGIATLMGFRIKSELETQAAIIALQSQEWAKALALAESADSFAYRSDPGGLPVAAQRGFAVTQLKDRAAQLAFAEEALSVRPWHPQVQVQYVVALMANGRIGEAEDHLRAITKVHPTYKPAVMNLAAILEHTGRPEEAALWRERLTWE